MKQLILITTLCLLAIMCTRVQASVEKTTNLVQTSIVSMSTTNDLAYIYVKWTGSGSIVANGVELVKIDETDPVPNVIPVTADGSVVLTATEDVQLTLLGCTQNSLTTLDIANCPELTELHCNDNLLTALDVSNCPKLTELYCSSNSLTALDVTKCTKLTRLDCGYSFLTSLGITNCPELEWLDCDYNFLTALDISNCPELKSLSCKGNSISALDIKNSPKLGYLYADYQKIMLPVVRIDNDILSIKIPVANIDEISHDGILTGDSITWVRERESGKVTFNFTSELSNEIGGMLLSGTVTQPWTKTKSKENIQTLSQASIVTMTTVDDSVRIYVEWTGTGSISANGTVLTNGSNMEIFPSIDGIIAVATMGDVQLTTLLCENNYLTALDITNCPELSRLDCSGNSLSALDITGCPGLTNLDCSYNSLSALDITNCPELKVLKCYNNSLPTLDVTNCLGLTRLDCHYNSLTDLDITRCSGLTNLICGTNRLVTLDVMNCTELTEFRCSGNYLRNLDLTKCSLLTVLDCNGNSLTTLDVTNCPELTELWCSQNNLTSLNVTRCPKLIELFCYMNRLSTLDITKCKDLSYLDCHSNYLLTLDVTRCPKLTTLNAFYQIPVLPTVTTNDTGISIKNPIRCVGAKVMIDEISHEGVYNNDTIIWTVSGESGEVTFEFHAKLPERITEAFFSGIITQPWIRK